MLARKSCWMDSPQLPRGLRRGASPTDTRVAAGLSALTVSTPGRAQGGDRGLGQGSAGSWERGTSGRTRFRKIPGRERGRPEPAL